MSDPTFRDSQARYIQEVAFINRREAQDRKDLGKVSRRDGNGFVSLILIVGFLVWLNFKFLAG